MAAEVKKEIELQIAHVLFIDIVGYSTFSAHEQNSRIEELNQIVRLSEQFQKAQAAKRILKVPSGDGMALVFYKSPEEPAQCAFEISRALKQHRRLRIRMGIHSGLVSAVVDVDERTNVAGPGINLAQRVMDCGDAGHILVTRHVAEDLAEYERWRPFLHDIGTFEVKHGVQVNVTNLYSDQVGNPQAAEQTQAAKTTSRPYPLGRDCSLRCSYWRLSLVALSFSSRRPLPLAPGIVEKSIAVLPFKNLSTEKQNEYFAEGVQDEILTHLARLPT